MTPISDASSAGSASDPSPAPALETVLDLSYLHSLAGQPGPLRHLVRTFLDRVEPVPRRLAQAIEGHDHRLVRDLLHELYGDAGNVGARTLQAACQRLLDRSPTAGGDRPARGAEEIAIALHLTRAAFARFLDGLPPSPEPTSGRPPSPEPTSGRPPSPRTLLILDDSPTLRERLRQVLADDYHLVEAATGRAALAACAGEPPPDLLLVDLNLGSSPGQENDLSGLDVVRQLKGTIPCVVLTVDRSRETRRAAL